jgi:bleomycin hydrolase
MNLKSTLSLLLISLIINGFAQVDKNKGTFVEYEPGYYQNSILKDIREVAKRQKRKTSRKYFRMDYTGMDVPNKVADYKDHTAWHFAPESQGNAGTCWCFSTTSFLESEVKRIHNKEIELSEIYTVYWEYVEKARGFVNTRGKSEFSEGSEANAVTRMYAMYGIVPNQVYSGLKDGRKHHTHSAMKEEMDSYLDWVKENNAWNEDEVLATIKAIMNHHIGEPPTEFEWEGKKYTPKSFLSDYLKMNMEDYIDVLSYKQEPYWKKVEYKVPDNWWHSEDYYNVPLDDFMKILVDAVKNGYTVSIGGDVSEAGFDRGTQCAMVASFDIPSEFINEDARQFRFSNESTTDDHGMHLVGYTEKDGKLWFLVKDSSAGSRNNDENAPEFGYYFFHEDYVKLKMMDFCVHKDAFKDYFKKFK